MSGAGAVGSGPWGGSPYSGYLYSYPHKTAYRPLAPVVALDRLWADEDKRALSLYLHVPFCEMRCGFCNLFTRSRPPSDTVSAWLATLERQVRVVRDWLGPATFARAAVGGGTPTMLDPAQLETALGLLGQLGASGVPTSVETSPATATPDRLAVLARAGVTRVSIGVQSFEPGEVRTAQRPQSASQVDAALEAIRALGFPVLNLDLIYGIPGQDPASWERSLSAALRWSPEELYLYPLYVRPLTGMAARARTPDDEHRLVLYAVARELLVGCGYEQVSMRMFRRPGPRVEPTYRCQEDGMVGLGVGARSYTRALHYATDYAVGARSVAGIIDRWIAEPDSAFGVARHGVVLDAAEQARRRVILTLLGAERVVDPPPELRPLLHALVERGFARGEGEGVVLTPEGIGHSDAIGPALISPTVRARMSEWEAR